VSRGPAVASGAAPALLSAQSLHPPSPGCQHIAYSGGVEPVGVVEIAERLGVTRKAVDAWRMRDLGFPEPRWTVGGRPAWEWEDVEAWARATSRLP
jgi:predicted DNA-binding transcriptional regulator AlpA